MKEPSDGTEMAHAAGHLNIESILKCAYCPEEDTLLFGEAALRCSRCGVHYPVRDGIFMMYSPDGESVEDVRSWKEHERAHHDSVVDVYETSLCPKGDSLTFIESSSAFRRLNGFLRLADGTVLDYGCGPGADTVEFLNRGLPVVAMDISEAMLRTAIKKASETRYPNLLKCVLADGEHLPFRRAVFDFISVRGVLHHIPRVDLALQEISRVLSANGKARIQEPSTRQSPLRGRLLHLAGLLSSFDRANGALATDEAQSGPPATSPPRDVGTERERPLSGPDTLRDCRAAGLKGEIFYWTDYSAVFHTLPLRLAVPLADMCVRIDGLSEAGEIFCILAKKEAER